MGFGRNIEELSERILVSRFETDSDVLQSLVTALQDRGEGSYLTVPELVDILNEEFTALGE